MADTLEGFFYGGHVVSDRRSLASLCLLFDRLHLATPYDKAEQLPGVVGFKRASRVLAAKRGVGALAARAVLDMLVEMLRRERLFLQKMDGERLIRKGVVVAHGELPGNDERTRARLLSAPKAKLASIFRAGAASVAVATGLTLSDNSIVFVGSNPGLPVPATAVLLREGNFLGRGVETVRVDLPWIQVGSIDGKGLVTARERLAKVLVPYRTALGRMLGRVRKLLEDGAGREELEAEATRLAEGQVHAACLDVAERLKTTKGAEFRRLRTRKGQPRMLSLRMLPRAELQALIDGGVEIVGGLDELLGGRGAALNRVLTVGIMALELRPREVGRAVGIKIVRKKKDGDGAPGDGDAKSEGDSEGEEDASGGDAEAD